MCCPCDRISSRSLIVLSSYELSGMTTNSSDYDMVPVEAAVRCVLEQAAPLAVVTVPLSEALDRIVADDIVSTNPFPPFRASIMDGYAVRSSDGAGIYPIVADVTAGPTEGQSLELKAGHVAYITTGAPVPEGADAVVMVEKTELAPEGRVRIMDDEVKAGQFIRPVGYDIQAGQTVIRAGDRLGPAELALCASLGLMEVEVVARPRVAVLSTGNELVEASATPTNGQIRDSNRVMLLAAVRAANAIPVDMGIVPDEQDLLQAKLQEALAQADIVVLSGGVSMGSKDYIKPILASLGTIHFGRMMMKPGKPATFATIAHPHYSHANNNSDCDRSPTSPLLSKKLVFGLPGNPVSALVCFQLLVEVAIRRLQGYKQATPVSVQARLLQSIKKDPVRPEYHRVHVQWDESKAEFTASSTGPQDSSRLMSMRAANGLLVVPSSSANDSILAVGTTATVFITGSLHFPQPPPSPVVPSGPLVTCGCDHGHGHQTKKEHSHHKAHAHPHEKKVDHAHPSSTSSSASSSSSSQSNAAFEMRVALLTVSDRVSRREAVDLTGPEAIKFFQTQGNLPNGVTAKIVKTAVVPDEREDITRVIRQLCDPDETSTAEQPHLLLTLGGTGFSERDITPEAVSPLLHRQAPGFVFAMIQQSLQHTPMAILSRPVAGTRFKTLIMTLPGSPKAVKEVMSGVIGVLPHALKLMHNPADPHHVNPTNKEHNDRHASSHHRPTDSK